MINWRDEHSRCWFPRVPDEMSKDSQIEQLTADRDRWQAKAFDLGNGMMEAMAERDKARQEARLDAHELQVFNKLATDLWADLIATRRELAEVTRCQRN